MATIPESALYPHDLRVTETKPARARGWMRLGILAASAVAGGVAAAWYYRKTLAQLRQAGSLPENSSSAFSASDEDA